MTITALALLLAAAQPDGFTQLGAHEHGRGELLAATGADGRLEITLIAPAIDIYGAEGARLTAEAIAAGGAALSQDGLVTLNGEAGCTLASLDVSGPAPDAHDHSHEHEDSHDHGDHDHDHAHEHGEGHDHDSHGHADVEAMFVFTCEDAAALERLSADGLFAAFPTLETLDAQFYDGARSAAASLTPSRPGLTIR